MDHNPRPNTKMIVSFAPSVKTNALVRLTSEYTWIIIGEFTGLIGRIRRIGLINAEKAPKRRAFVKC
jgi:hypothetical protein